MSRYCWQQMLRIVAAAALSNGYKLEELWSGCKRSSSTGHQSKAERIIVIEDTFKQKALISCTLLQAWKKETYSPVSVVKENVEMLIGEKRGERMKEKVSKTWKKTASPCWHLAHRTLLVRGRVGSDATSWSTWVLSSALWKTSFRYTQLLSATSYSLITTHKQKSHNSISLSLFMASATYIL
jgi:hypothetical protein